MHFVVHLWCWCQLCAVFAILNEIHIAFFFSQWEAEWFIYGLTGWNRSDTQCVRVHSVCVCVCMCVFVLHLLESCRSVIADATLCHPGFALSSCEPMGWVIFILACPYRREEGAVGMSMPERLKVKLHLGKKLEKSWYRTRDGNESKIIGCSMCLCVCVLKCDEAGVSIHSHAGNS